MRWITVIVDSTAISHSTGAMRLNKAPMITSTRRSGRSMKPTRQEADERFGAGARVADHDGADHHEGGQDHVEETVAAGVKNQQSEKLGGVAVAVNDRIEEAAEAGHLVAGAGDASVDQVEETRSR